MRAAGAMPIHSQWAMPSPSPAWSDGAACGIHLRFIDDDESDEEEEVAEAAEDEDYAREGMEEVGTDEYVAAPEPPAEGERGEINSGAKATRRGDVGVSVLETWLAVVSYGATYRLRAARDACP